ncbi:MAG: MBL fold metallo-hydrolase [Candidatus Acidiferrales bacterium]
MLNNHNAFSRRTLLTSASSLAALAAADKLFPSRAFAISAQGANPAAAPLLDKGFAAVHRLADGVYATIADGSKGLQAVSNGGLVVGRDAAFIIEGHMHPAGAALELEALRSLTQAPVRGALNTHYHFDHTFGNAFYGAQGIPIWAHSRTATLMTERYAALQGKDNSGLIAPTEKRIASAKDETTRQRAQGDLNAFRWFVSSVEGTVLALPNHPLDPAKLPMKLDLGGITVVLEAREGHSPTDIIARVPERNITFAGDLVFNGSYPVTFDADMTAWHNVMRVFAGFDKSERFVPGHGPVCGKDWIAQQTAIMNDIAAQAEKLHSAGVPVEEAKQRYVIPEKFKSLNMFSWFFCIENAIADHYKSFARS